MTYKQISFDERKIIEKLYKSGHTITDISKAVGRPIKTVKSELDRCPVGKYTAEAAQRDRDAKKQITVKEAHKQDQERNIERYKRLIRTCLMVNPSADVEIIAKATNMPVERVEKYYEEVQKSCIKPRRLSCVHLGQEREL